MKPEIKQRIDQICRGEVPEGYKKVKMWVCPVEWKITTLNTVADVGQGYTFKREYQGQSVGRWNYFKVADIGLKNTGIYLSSAINKVDDSLIKQMGCKPFSAGSIVFPRVGAALLNNNKRILLQDSIVDDNVLVLTVKDIFTCNNIFLYYLLSRLRLEDWCNSGLVPVINSKTVLKQTVNLPPIEEQQKIAAILTTQDKVIELKERRLAEKQRQKKHLMQQLLTGKKRLPGFSEEWKIKPLKKLTEKQKKKNHGFQYRLVLSNSAQHGIVSQDQEFDKEIANEERIDGYYVVIPGAFVYNPRISVTAPCGPINVNETGETGIMSPLYTVFTISSPQISQDFLKYYFQSSCWYKYVKGVANYGARHDRISISDGDFFDMPIPLPTKEEQSYIAKVLSASNREIELLQQDIEQEKQKKKALMQLLLKGIVRVKI